MPRISPFERYADQYEEWFVQHRRVYEAELRAVRGVIPGGLGLEVGVGTGRFAGPLGIKIGVEPSKHMAYVARKRGMQVLNAVAEELPFSDSMFDFVLMVTTVCFVDNISKSFGEAHRVLCDGGVIIVGFVDRNSKMGRIYLDHKEENVFYREATFFSVEELVQYMENTGFTDLRFNQTIFATLGETAEDEPVRPGYGEGSFVVIQASSGGREWKGN